LPLARKLPGEEEKPAIRAKPAIARHDERLALNVESRIIFAGDVGSPETS